MTLRTMNTLKQKQRKQMQCLVMKITSEELVFDLIGWCKCTDNSRVFLSRQRKSMLHVFCGDMRKLENDKYIAAEGASNTGKVFRQFR